MSTTSPRLPPEILEEIIEHGWRLKLSTSERIQFMTTFPLVSIDFFTSYLRISSKDVYIPSLPYVDYYIRLLREDGGFYPTEKSKKYPAQLCRSITIEIFQPISPHRALHWSTEPPMGVALSDLLYSLRLFGEIPTFRDLIIRYVDVDVNDLFDWARFIDFPQTVECLYLEFVQRENDEPPPKIVITPPGHSPYLSLWTLPHLLHLQVTGADENFVSRLVSAAPNLETVVHIR